MQEISFEQFRGYLRNRLPEARPLLAEMEAKEAEYAEEEGDSTPTDAYGVMSEVFWWGVFEPALRGAEEELVSRCFEIVDEILRWGDDNLIQTLHIRVLEWLATEWREKSVETGGPLLLRTMR